MQALTSPPSDLVHLRGRRDALRSLVDQHADLALRLAAVHTARTQGNPRMHLPVPLGMGYRVEGLVPDTARVLCAAGLDDLFLDLDLDHARVFVDQRTVILRQKLSALEEHVVRLEREHDLVVKTLRTAFQLETERPKSVQGEARA